MGNCRCGFIAVLTMLFAFGVFAEEGSVSLIPKANPHSKALGQRIAGGVLCGLGGVNLATGIICKSAKVFETSYADLGMRETGEMFDNLIWVEGAIMLGIGIPLAIVGNVKFGKWNKWQQEHGMKVAVRGNSLVMEF